MRDLGNILIDGRLMDKSELRQDLIVKDVRFQKSVIFLGLCSLYSSFKHNLEASKYSLCNDTLKLWNITRLLSDVVWTLHFKILWHETFSRFHDPGPFSQEL